MMSDIQETLAYDKRTLDGMNKLIEKEKPDLVILGGDNCDGTVLKTEQELRDYIKIFSEPMESKKIPWAHVFGNHDHDIEIDDIQKTKIYEEYEYCISNIPKTYMELQILYYLLNIQIKTKLHLTYGD